MVNKPNLRVTTIQRPTFTFTPAVTRDDLTKLHHKPTHFGAGETGATIYTEDETRTRRLRQAESTLRPDPAKRWSYHQTLELYRGDHCLDRGRCVDATWTDSKTLLKVRWSDFSWDLDSIMLRRCVTLNMRGPEQAYWLVRLMHSGKDPDILGFAPDTTLRLFRYAVPLTGLSNGDSARLVGHSDFGVTSSDPNDPTNRLIAQLTKDVDRDSWAVDVPKIFGGVVARTPLEAEAHALRRARFAADLLTFAVHTGASHFDTTYDTQHLDWAAIDSIAAVSTQPWLLLFEATTLKGWIRSVPLTFIGRRTRLGAIRKRVRTFLNNFSRVAASGDAAEQLQINAPRAAREDRISKAVQTAVHWLAEAARMPEDDDYRLLPVWTALEAVLSAIEYPPVFDKRRLDIKRQLLAAINGIEGADVDEIAPLKDLLRTRLLNNAWPIRRQLELFAEAFGVRLHAGDSEVVKRLARIRGQAVHTGGAPVEGLGCEIEQLRYLVDRLVMAASVCAVRAPTKDEGYAIKIVGLEPGTTGAATIYIDGKEVPYTLRSKSKPDGTQAMVVTSDGLIYDDSNSVIV